MIHVNTATTMLSDLDGSFRSHSLESLNPNALADKVAALFQSASHTLSTVGSGMVPASLKFSPTPDLEAILKSADYVSVRQTTISKPVGLKVTYLTFAEALIAAAESLSKLEDDCLDNAKRVLSKLYGESGELAGDYKYPEFDKVAHFHKGTILSKGMIKGCFDPKASNSYGNYGDLFANSAEVTKVKARIIELNTKVTKIDLKKVQKELKEVSDLANDLAKLIADQNIAVSSHMAANLSALLYNCAESVELLGVVLTMQAIINNTYEQTRTELRNTLK